MAVTCHYAERTLARPVDTRLYLPHRWADDRDLRRAAHIPDGVTFQTKPQLALSLLDEACALGIPQACVTVDAGYGDAASFLNALEHRDEPYVVAIASDFTVASTRTSAPLRADALLATVPRWQWTPVTWAEGNNGELHAKAHALRCYRVDSDGWRHLGWLLGQRASHGQQGAAKYFWGSLGPQAALATMLEYVHRRHWIEQYYEEAKEELGWDDFQGQRYDALPRHAVTIMLSYSFLVCLEWRERQQVRRRGRRRRAFSPSAGQTTAHDPARAPRGRRLAAAGGAPNTATTISPAQHVPAPALTKQY